MALSDEYRPRLSIVLTEKQRKRLSKALPWGAGRILFSAIVDDVIDLLEQFGMAAAGLIVSKRATLLELLVMKEQKVEVCHATSGPEVVHPEHDSAGGDLSNTLNKTESKTKQKASRKAKKS